MSKGVALLLAIGCGLVIEIAATWILFWLYCMIRFCKFFRAYKDNYTLDHPSIFLVMRERERMAEDFVDSLDGDVLKMELLRAHCWPSQFYQSLILGMGMCRQQCHILCRLVRYPAVYRRYLRFLHFRLRTRAWPQRFIGRTQIVLFQGAWILLDRIDACYCQYRNVRYLWMHPRLRARYLRRTCYRMRAAVRRFYRSLI